MKEVKFTKGEWRIEKEVDSIMITDNSRSRNFIAKIPSHWINREGNARLICAVPDLFEACAQVVHDYEGDGMENMQARDHVFYELCKKATNKAMGL